MRQFIFIIFISWLLMSVAAGGGQKKKPRQKARINNAHSKNEHDDFTAILAHDGSPQSMYDALLRTFDESQIDMVTYSEKVEEASLFVTQVLESSKDLVEDLALHHDAFDQFLDCSNVGSDVQQSNAVLRKLLQDYATIKTSEYLYVKTESIIYLSFFREYLAVLKAGRVQKFHVYNIVANLHRLILLMTNSIFVEINMARDRLLGLKKTLIKVHGYKYRSKIQDENLLALELSTLELLKLEDIEKIFSQLDLTRSSSINSVTQMAIADIRSNLSKFPDFTRAISLIMDVVITYMGVYSILIPTVAGNQAFLHMLSEWHKSLPIHNLASVRMDHRNKVKSNLLSMLNNPGNEEIYDPFEAKADHITDLFAIDRVFKIWNAMAQQEEYIQLCFAQRNQYYLLTRQEQAEWLASQYKAYRQLIADIYTHLYRFYREIMIGEFISLKPGVYRSIQVSDDDANSISTQEIGQLSEALEQSFLLDENDDDNGQQQALASEDVQINRDEDAPIARDYPGYGNKNEDFEVDSYHYKPEIGLEKQSDSILKTNTQPPTDSDDIPSRKDICRSLEQYGRYQFNGCDELQSKSIPQISIKKNQMRILCQIMYGEIEGGSNVQFLDFKKLLAQFGASFTPKGGSIERIDIPWIRKDFKIIDGPHKSTTRLGRNVIKGARNVLNHFQILPEFFTPVY
ncbi:hypothetical protein MIR68_008376 [Amoeboaphelidium protococcarum]|nr:hypothetical protein MIR68_008376 [Amoeboaphelidium protococcarum]